MIHLKKHSLNSIIHSNEGIHLTSYLENRGNIFELKKQIRKSIDVAREHLSTVMDEEDLKKFVAPLSQLLQDSKILKNFNSNIGLFRTRDSFRMIGIPIDIEHICVVATSFHVKPLLRWIQADKEFLFLGIENQSASLYLGTQKTLKHIDTIFTQVRFQKSGFDMNLDSIVQKRIQEEYLDEIIEWMNEKLYHLNEKNKAPLFVAGSSSFVKRVSLRLRYSQLIKKPISNTFSNEKISDAIAIVRQLLHQENEKNLEKSFVEYYWAEDMQLGIKNIFQIAKAVVEQKVRKLIIAEDIHIFGKLNKTTGELSIYPAHWDHEDDDLLDDLSQIVLSSGGEVIVVPKNQIPKGRPILAILKGSPDQRFNGGHNKKFMQLSC